MIQIDVKPAVDALRHKLGNLSPRQVSTILARTLNHTMAKAQTAANRQIRKTYNVRARDVRAAMRRVRARVNMLEARIDLTGTPLPLIAFGARPVSTGVSVAVLKGQRKRIERAFIQTMPGGHRGVFARGQYERGKFGFRTKRITPKGNDLPITELTGIAVPMALGNEEVMRAIAQGIRDHFGPRLEHELEHYMAGLVPTPISDVEW